ncbi:MAG: wax ester/triacylglycerol synthase family O-acyltransferase [Parasphingorhabdus sp.]|nr:wax ester/triacylglycerol synthase family O-acyltransferase [Parasphingorhabdus sp.]
MPQQLGAQDAQFLYIQSPGTLTHIMALYIYDPSTAPGGKVRFKDIIAHVEGRLHISPVFKRKLYRLPFDLDHPYWVADPHFDIEAHISHVRLPEPGDWRQFCIHVARHFSRPMDMDRPLWDMYVIEGLDRIEGFAKGSFAIATRVHHAAIDGASAAYFFTALGDKDAKGNPVIPVEPYTEELGEPPSSTEVMQRMLSSNLQSPVKLTNALMKLTPALWDMAQKNLAGDDSADRLKIPQTRFNAPVSPHKMFDAVTFPLDELKAMRLKAAGATINDVVLTICAGALRRYLQKHRELPKAPLVAVAPVNLRDRAGQESMPGNKISAMTVNLRTDIADPLERLAAIRDITGSTKAGKSGISARIMTDLTQHIPGATMSAAARVLTSERFAPRMTNLFISNVPGPQFPIFFAGAKLTHQYGMAPLAHGMGLFIATPSYNGTMSFAITSDRAIMPDIDFFRECIIASFAELKDAVPSQSAKKIVQPRKKSVASKR